MTVSEHSTGHRLPRVGRKRHACRWVEERHVDGVKNANLVLLTFEWSEPGLTGPVAKVTKITHVTSVGRIVSLSLTGEDQVAATQCIAL
jgi:hypothetical protein